MSHKRLTAWQKASALVPLALLSGAWTTSIAATNLSDAASDQPATLPDGTLLPDEALKVPASMSRPGALASGVPADAAEGVVEDVSTNGIPAAALAAYQRAERVINAADPSCNLSWHLIAAIGRVESDHGRYGGNTLGDDGRSRPGIYGIPLDGSNGTAEIGDTDSGDLDDDAVFDRAVGPMQFIPSTWSVVGVDGDGDGVRDPQDIDDAALASAVYLCSGDEDLSTYEGQKAAVYRYNHSEEYVDLVLAIMNAYHRGTYTEVPNGAAAPTVLTPERRTDTAAPATGAETGPADGSGPTSVPAADAPTTGSVDTGDSGDGDSDGGQTGASPDDPADQPGEDTSKDPVAQVEKAGTKTLSDLERAKQTCQENFTAGEIDAMGGLTTCAEAVLDGGLGGAKNLLAAVTAPVEDTTVGDVTGPLP